MDLKKLISIAILSVLIGLSGGLWAKYIADPWFESNALLEPSLDEYKSNLSQIFSRNNPFGGVMSSGLANSVTFSPASALKRKVVTRSFTEKLNINEEFLKRVFFEDWDEALNEWKNIKRTEDLRQFLVLNLNVADDLSTDLIEISVLTKDNKLSQDLLISIIKLLNEAEKEKVIRVSNGLIEKSNQYLADSSSMIADDTYVGIIETELRKKLLAETHSNHYVEVLDKPSLASKKSKPRGSSYAIFFFTLSFMTMIIFSVRNQIVAFVRRDLKKLIS